MTYSKIAGTGGYLPKRVVTNKDLEDLVETTDEWIRERTGIKRRHVAADDETTSDMAVAAAEKAIAASGIRNDEIDLIVLATTTPDKVFPSSACLVQRQLGIKDCPAFDVHAACSGFIYAMDVALLTLPRREKPGKAASLLAQRSKKWVAAKQYFLSNVSDRGPSRTTPLKAEDLVATGEIPYRWW